MQLMHTIVHIQSQSNPMCAYMHKQKGTFVIYFIIIKNICYTQSMKFVSLRTTVRPATGL